MYKVKPGDLLFVWGDTWIAEEIQEITHGASHVAMFVGENKLFEAQGGTKVHELDASFYLNNYTEVWTDDSLTDDERQKMIDYAKTLYGEEYDYLLILFELVHFKLGGNVDYKEHHKLICSTAVNQCAKQVNKVWTDKVDPAPSDLQTYGSLHKTDCSLKELLS